MNENAGFYQCPRCERYYALGQFCEPCAEWLRDEAPSREQMTPEERGQEFLMWTGGVLSVPADLLDERLDELVGRSFQTLELIYAKGDLLLEATGQLEAPADVVENLGRILPAEIREKVISVDLDTGEVGNAPTYPYPDFGELLDRE